MKSLQEISIQFIKGVGPARKRLFVNLGIESVEDILYFFPRRYEDRRNITPIAKTKPGEWQTVTGKVLVQGGRKTWFTKKHVYELVLEDKTGRMICVWFNQPYLDRYFKPGMLVVCFGKVQLYKNKLQMVSPEYEVIESEDDLQLSANRIVPVYPLTRGITQRFLRKTIYACLEKYKNSLIDELSIPLRNKYRLPNIKRSLSNIHFPESLEDQDMALKRISFEEFYFFQISIILRRLSLMTKEGFIHQISESFALEYAQNFPFELTSAQKKAICEIRADMVKDFPMLRLLQGDVGSGKTIVALFGCLAAFESGFQSAFMAPTEILAKQHYETIEKYFSQGPLKNLKMAFLASSLSAEERKRTIKLISEGKIDLVVGTHALLSEDVTFKNLSFVVIDEQHKFGVRQRALLSEKGRNPDVLIMTATPIPRTLCITLYGDLDVSILNELPPGRGKIKTVHYSQEKIEAVYQTIRSKVKEGRQVYIVYPIIEDSESLDLKAAQKMFHQFSKIEFKDLKVELVHGRLPKNKTETIMKRFKNKEIDILVATTILEVGLDVPNANVMVIEHAERFGLSQLHQLRGRIGRGQEDALCILIADPQTLESQKRLEAIVSTTDGFKIAEQDLLIRGPGRFFGRHQHGLNELKVANPATQLDILELARQEALELTKEDPVLEKPRHVSIKKLIMKRYPTYLTMVQAG